MKFPRAETFLLLLISCFSTSTFALKIRSALLTIALVALLFITLVANLHTGAPHNRNMIELVKYRIHMRYFGHINN